VFVYAYDFWRTKRTKEVRPVTFLGGISGPTNSNSYVDYSHIAGLATGIDTDSMVEALMRAERMPLDRLLQQKQLWQWKQEDYRTVNNALRELRDNLFSLKLQSTFLVKTATSTNSTAVTASAVPTADAGTYAIEVTKLATSSSVVSSAELTIDPAAKLSSEVSFTINGQDFTFAANTVSLNDIIVQVNKSAAGVTMGYDAASKKVFMSAKQTGASAPFAFSGDFLTNTLQLQSVTQGTNAEFTINGLSTWSSTNAYTINGTSFSFTGTGSAVVTVASDTESVVQSIKDFVDKFNSTMKTMTDLYYQKRNRDYPPLTDEQRAAMKDDQIKKWEEKARSGMLANDPTLDRAITSLRSLLSATVSGQPTSTVNGTSTVLDTLSDLGITTGDWWTHGQLQVDETKLRQAVEADPEAVMRLFTNPHADGISTDPNDSFAGIAVRMYDAVNSAMKLITDTAGASTDLVDNSLIGQRLREIDERAYRMQRQLDDKRQQYYLQFTRLEEAINQMNSQSMYLMSMLGGQQ